MIVKAATRTFGPADHGRAVTDAELAGARWVEGYHYEVIDGRLYVSPLPELPHDDLVEWLADLLRAHAEHLGLDVEIRAMGDGFTWVTQNREQDIATTRQIWDVCKEAINSHKYDLVILDEINVVMSARLGYLDPKEVIEVLKARDPDLHVVLTGRGAPPEICELADTVSEISAVKHHYRAGVKAQPGIEF